MTRSRGTAAAKDDAAAGGRKGPARADGHRSPDLLDVSRITSKGQITLPKTVRRTLGVAEGDDVCFRTVEGRIVIEPHARAEEEGDPAVAAFLALLENDIAANPGAAGDFPEPLLAAMRLLTAGLEVDLEAEIDGDVAI